jgi:hypothetical protein
MYRFPHPLTLDPSGIGRCRLILPAEWGLCDQRLIRVGSLERTVCAAKLEGYCIHLDGKTRPTASGTPHPDAGAVRRFDIFEAV